MLRKESTHAMVIWLCYTYNAHWLCSITFKLKLKREVRLEPLPHIVGHASQLRLASIAGAAAAVSAWLHVTVTGCLMYVWL